MFNESQNEKKSTDLELYSSSLGHLTQEHKDYFFKWFKMLDLGKFNL